MRGNERGPVAEQEVAVEQNFIGRHLRAVKAIGVASVTGAVMFTAGNYLGGHAAEMNLSSGSVKAKRLSLEPIELRCDAESVWKIDDAKFEYNAEVKRHKVPGYGADIQFKDTNIVLQTCQKDASKNTTAASPTSEIATIDKQDGKSVVKVNIDNIVTNVDIPTGNKNVDINADAPLKAIGGSASVASAVIEGACRAVTLFQAGKECKAFAANIDDFKRDFDANSEDRANNALLESFRTEASKRDWANTKLVITDSYKQQAINKADGDTSAADEVKVVFVDASGNPTDKVPAFEDVYKDLRDKGILKPSGVSIKEKSKIKITLETPPYVPKHFDPRTEGVQ